MRCVRLKWRFRLVFLSLLERGVVLGYKTLKFIFLSFFLLSWDNHMLFVNTCCFKDTSYHLFFTRREFKEEDKVKEETTKDDDGRRRGEKG